ncbi:uncharacterized protein PAC_17979 [Phialocephala subalpina]|uniref:Methyltransferase domain-containing protein n=1 Tax=Phialocephala subalpina TaxID=576137 RepID=A0A1L7XSS0_9HELO|nr:uncharacterized protein PAC_17979 [Phialocephala subalpina]
MATLNPTQLQTKASSLAVHFVETRPDPSTSSPSLISQMRHRLRLATFWDIKPGSRVLEIGCGQGDTTIVLADAVGSPFNLGQAQQHIKTSAVGSRVTFHTPMDPIEYLDSYTGPKYDYVVLSHCIYYFATPLHLPLLVSALTSHTKHLVIAEWSLTPSLLHPIQTYPHVLAALLLTHLESHRSVSSDGNIRTVLSPSQIKAFATQKNLKLEKEAVLEADEGLRDGYWEVRDLLSGERKERELDELFTGEGKEKERVVAGAMFDALRSATDAVGGLEGVRCMSVWSGVFVLEE